MLLIPKPNKQPVHPAALRPLALQEPVGKALVGILASKAQHAMMPEMTKWPIWAYLPMRSTQDALLRVTRHCTEVRTLLATQRSTPFTREQKAQKYRVAGGICIFLDIERAFDMVNRAQLFSKLESLGMPPQIAYLLNMWHQDTGYNLYTQGTERYIKVGRGLRQGCKAAPLLWNGYLLAFLAELKERVSHSWILRCLNFYADDGQMGDSFRSETALHDLLTNIYATLDLLNEFGMTINSAKCTALVAMTGTSCRKLRTALTTFRDGKEWLKLEQAHKPTIWLPVATHAKYLGTVMSYKQLEDQTVLHRIQLSKIAFHRLSRWLKGKRGMPTWQRLRIWSTCVYPVLSYGICTVGITSLGATKLQQTMYSMLRQILDNHAYVTGQSHQQVLAKHRVELPLIWIVKTIDSLQQSVTQRLLYTAVHDVVNWLDWTHLSNLKAFLMAQLHTGPVESHLPRAEPDALPAQLYCCNKCDFQTPSVAIFRRHCTQIHGHRMNRMFTSNPAQYMLHGLPQCRFCYRTFTTWRTFVHHIQCGCQVLQAGPLECWQPAAGHIAEAHGGLVTMLAPRPEAPVRGQQLITDADLQNLKSQEWGNRILTIVGTRNWHHMRGEKAACEYLASRCCLCDQFLGRTQDLNHHLKLLHPEYWPHTAAKGKQLTAMHGDETPCPYCNALFTNMHQCTVWTQLAMLLVHGGSSFDQDSLGPPNVLKCELCNQVHDTAEALHAHLTLDHRLVSTSYNPARDSVAGEPACAHCGALFEHLESLRSHVNQGRCPRFDPDLPTEVLDVQDSWIAATCHGELAKTLCDAHTRLQLTIQCQSCSSRYHRANDLSGHLQSAHSSLWSASQRLCHLLVSLVYSDVGCTCNPSVSNPRANHVCLTLTQLAMQHMRIPDAIFYPITPTDEELAQMFSPKLDRATRFLFEQLLTNRQLPAFWQDANVLEVTRSQCLFCGEKNHAGALTMHLHEAHQGGLPLVKFILQQLLPHFLQRNDTDHQCFACTQVFNHKLEDAAATCDDVRQQVVQVHYRAQCPSILQAAVVLSRAAHGRLTNVRRGRGVQPDLERLPGPLTMAGHQPEADPECQPKAAKKRRTQKGQPCHRQQGQDPSSQGNDHAGNLGHQIGQRDPNYEERGHLHFLFRQQRQRELSAHLDRNDGAMGPEARREPEGGSTTAEHAVETAPDAGPFQQPAHEDRTVGECAGGGRNLESGAAEPCAAEGQDLPVSGMESQQESLDGQQQTATHAEAPASAVQRTPGSPGQPGLGGEVSCVAFGEQTGSLPMEIAAQHEDGRALAPAANPLQLGHMAPHGSNSEGTQPCAEPSSPQLAESPESDTVDQGQGERQEQNDSRDETGVNADSGQQPDHQIMLQRLSHLLLENPGNICFANSAVYSLLWTTLTVQPWHPALWGTQSRDLHQFLFSKSRSNLLEEPWLQQILRCWGERDLLFDPVNVEQQDAAEFVSTWLGLMQTPAFDMSWERRMEENDMTRAFDNSHCHTPLSLKFNSFLANFMTCDLTQLLRLWRQVDGMCAALLHAPQCLCLHVDRCTQDANQTIYKSDCMIHVDEPCLVPVFTDDSLRFEMVEYQVMALTAHFGADGQGHYRTALRIAPTVLHLAQPANWLLTDDWQLPQPVWNVPPWMKRCATMFWLVRVDCAHIWRFRPISMQQTALTKESSDA